MSFVIKLTKLFTILKNSILPNLSTITTLKGFYNGYLK